MFMVKKIGQELKEGYAGLQKQLIIREDKRLNYRSKSLPYGKFNRVNFRYTTAAFLVASGDYPTCLLAGKSPEPRALVCCATLPFEVALYAVSVPRIKSGAGSCHRLVFMSMIVTINRVHPDTLYIENFFETAFARAG
jgi:hypothetical protein